MRKHVCVLVRIQVGDRDARRLQLAYLGRCLSFDLIRSQTPKQGERGKLADAFAKARSSGDAAAADRSASALQRALTRGMPSTSTM